MRIACIVILITTLLPSIQVKAEPNILIDDGGVSTDKYRSILRAPTEVPDFGGQWVQKYSPLIQKDPENLSLWLPLKTSALSPKRLSDADVVEVNFSELDAPICIIGSDDLSHRWIQSNLHLLIQMKTRCWLVQADNFEDFTYVSELLQGRVMMTPADGDAIADFFGIQYYPVFIDQRYIGQ